MSKGKRFILSLFGFIGGLIVLFSIFAKEPEILMEFDSVVSEFSFINDVSVSGISPALYIRFEIDDNISLEEVDKAFLNVRDILFKEKTIVNLMRFHKKNYGGTVMELHVTFIYLENDYKKYYDYYSYSETSGVPTINSFRNWVVDRNGEEEKFKR